MTELIIISKEDLEQLIKKAIIEATQSPPIAAVKEIEGDKFNQK